MCNPISGLEPQKVQCVGSNLAGFKFENWVMDMCLSPCYFKNHIPIMATNPQGLHVGVCGIYALRSRAFKII